jgi:hypothetical protein
MELVVVMTGATGAFFGVRLLEVLAKHDVETQACCIRRCLDSIPARGQGANHADLGVPLSEGRVLRPGLTGIRREGHRPVRRVRRDAASVLRQRGVPRVRAGRVLHGRRARRAVRVDQHRPGGWPRSSRSAACTRRSTSQHADRVLDHRRHPPAARRLSGRAAVGRGEQAVPAGRRTCLTGSGVRPLPQPAGERAVGEDDRTSVAR